MRQKTFRISLLLMVLCMFLVIVWDASSQMPNPPALITVSIGSNGNISPSGGAVPGGANGVIPVPETSIGSGTYPAQVFTVTPDSNFCILGVNLSTADPDYSFTGGMNPNGSATYTLGGLNTPLSYTYTISATFGHCITPSAGANGTISPDGSADTYGQGKVRVSHGSDQSFTITPNTGYQVSDVLVDGTSVGAVTDYPFTNLTANHTISASFEVRTFEIIASAGPGGKIEPSGTVIVNYGNNQSFNITPDTGYQIKDVLVDGSSVGAVPTYTFPNVTANHTISATFEIKTFTITSSAGANGSISPSGGVVVNYGSDQKFDITPDPHYHILDVKVDGVSVGKVPTYTFTNVTEDHTIDATFEIDKLKITATSGIGGTISPSGDVMVDYGSDRKFDITPNVGYHIVDVLVDSSSVGTVGSYTFNNVIEEHTIGATFEIDKFIITATAGANGKIAPSGNVVVDYGNNQKFDITPDIGYHIVDVLVDGTSVGAIPTYTFNNVKADHTISATFEIDKFTITATAGANGKIAPSGNVIVNYGSDQKFDITPDAHYHILDVLVDGASVGAVSTYTFTNVTADHTIDATFEIDKLTIISSSGANGKIEPLGAITVDYGNSQKFDITPNVGYHIKDVLVDGASVGAVPTYTFTSVTVDHTINATFEIDKFTIKATAGANGKIAPFGDVIVNYGSNQKFDITPDPHYHILDVLVDGASVGAVPTYTFTNVTANHTISATFEIDKFTIAATAGANGKIAPSGNVVVDYGNNQKFDITPNTGYHIKDVLVDGVSVGAIPTYTFTSVTADHTISAAFEIDKFTITATAGAGGKIAPSGNVMVDYGNSQKFDITPDTGYHVKDVLVDGASVGAVPTYTFSDVKAAHTISATFEIDKFTITATAGANGKIAPSGNVIVNYGSDQKFDITPDAGFHIFDVKVDGASVGAVNTYTFTNVTSDHTIDATFCHIITPSSGAGGKTDPAAAVKVLHGANQKVTIIPDPGFHVCDVLVDGVSVGAVESYTFSNVISDHTLNASFGHIVKGTSGGNGSVAPSGPLCVQPGTNVEFDINADANYHIAQVSLNGNPIALPVVPGQLLKQFKYNLNVTSDSEVSAGFEKDESTITATASSNGSITPSGEVRVAFGQDQTFNINANAGYSITDVLVDGASVGAVSSYSFINVMEDHTINATFSCKITSSSGDNGDIEPEGTLDIPYSNSQTYTMTPVFGYHVADVIVDGASVGTPGTYAFNGVNADHTISVTFAINVYTINVTAGSHGSGTPSTVNVNHGGSASFSIKPDPGYAIDEIMINGTYVTSYSDAFSNVTSNGSISVTFKKINPSITTVVQRGGRISPSGMVEVEQNGSQKFTITPDSGNQILDVRVGNSLPEVMEPGSSVGAVSEYTFENVTRDKYIHALFTVISPVITAKAGEHGSISPDGSIGVNPGDSQTFSIAAEPCYRIKNVKVDNAFIGAKDTYTFTNVISDHSIEAFFEKIPDSTITARAGKDGTIDPSGTSVAGCGTDKTFTMLPEPCYKVLDVKVDGVSVGAVGRYTFTNITASHSIEAVFGPISNSEGKKGELNCDGEINSKDVLLILNISAETVVPNSYQQWAADIDGNGVVNARDALLLLIQIITGAAAPSRDVAGTGHQVLAGLTDSYGKVGENVKVLLNVDQSGYVSVGDVSISYDGNMLRAVSVRPCGDMLLASNVTEPGMIRMSFAGTGASGRNLVEIEFDVTGDGTSPLVISDANLYQPDGQPLNLSLVHGRFRSLSARPEQNVLLQNYPNPFNPETWIPYQLSESSEVEVRIYTSMGQLVRTLRLGNVPAGYYDSRDRCAYWDGRNEAGESVSSGVYFYTIKASGFNATKKMIISR